MKKLILLLLFIPLVFSCSKSTDEEETQTLKQYLLSNLFVKNDKAGDYPYEEYIQFTLSNRLHNFTWFRTQPDYVSYNPSGILCSSQVKWNTCYFNGNTREGIITFEDDNKIIYEYTGVNSGIKYELTRTGNNINAKYIRNNTPIDYTLILTDYATFNKKKEEVNNIKCPCSTW